MTVDNDLPIKCVLNKTRQDEKYRLIIDCRYFIKKIQSKNKNFITNIHEGDQILKVNRSKFPIETVFIDEFRSMIFQLNV